MLTSCKGQIATGNKVSEPGKSILLVYQAKNNTYWFGSNGEGIYHYNPGAKESGKLLHYTTTDGLSNDTIREIQEDLHGNIFFTTHNGICKFDGEKFTTLPVDKSKINDWKANSGDLWFKGEPGKNGPYRYDGRTLFALEFPKHYMAGIVNATIPNQRYSPYEVYFIYKDKEKNIWFGTSNFGICRLKPDGTMSWMYEEHLQFVSGGGSFGIRSILEDSKGKFWFCNSLYWYSIFPSDTSAPPSAVDNPSADKAHRYINYARSEGVDLATGNETDYIYYLSIIEDKNHNIWMATYKNGVWKYDPSAPAGKNVTQYKVTENGKEITLYSVYEDRQGIIWLGTHEAGAYKFNGKTFEKFTP